MDNVERGTVTHWNGERGFGFIRPDQVGREDVFLHFRALPRGVVPAEGDRLSYGSEVTDKGERARWAMLE